MRHGVRAVAATLALGAALVAGGCSHEPAPTAAPVAAAPSVSASYDASLPPAAAVLALVPDDVTAVAVTDFDQVRADLGVPDVGDASAAADRSSFWQRAEQQRPLLTDGLLRPDDATLGAAYGFTSLDVAWEADLLDQAGRRVGWVLAFRSGTDLGAVQRAVQAGTAPLAGATVDAAHGLVSSGTTSDPAQSWATDPTLTALVARPATSTYASRRCTPGSVPAGAELDRLSAYAVQFGDQVATAWLGPGRTDLFTRMRLGAADPAFGQALTGGVADPTSGRIGFVMADAVAAARLALAGGLPFTVCG